MSSKDDDMWCQCEYCGYIWTTNTKSINSRRYIKNKLVGDWEVCPKCDDTHIKHKEIEKVDYYGE